MTFSIGGRARAGRQTRSQLQKTPDCTRCRTTSSDEADLVTAFYRATIPADVEKKFWRRTELIRVLRHWSWRARPGAGLVGLVAGKIIA